ncbi:hypothetical protein JZU54_08770, partial [bacterium]|nr:hypothetical protein [bacterium]
MRSAFSRSSAMRARALPLRLRRRLGGLVSDGRVPVGARAILGALDGLLRHLHGTCRLGAGGVELRSELDDRLMELLDDFLIDAPRQRREMG